MTEEVRVDLAQVSNELRTIKGDLAELRCEDLKPECEDLKSEPVALKSRLQDLESKKKVVTCEKLSKKHKLGSKKAVSTSNVVPLLNRWLKMMIHG